MGAVPRGNHMSDARGILCRLISRNSWPCADVGKWRRVPGIHIGTKEAIFSKSGPRVIGELVYHTILSLDPDVRAVAGDGVGGTAIAIAAASTVPRRGKQLIPLHVRLQSDVTRNKSLVEGLNDVPRGSHVAVVDDTVDTTRSISRVVSILQNAGCVVSAAVFLVARRQSSLDSLRSMGIKAVALLDLRDLRPRERSPNGR